MILLNTFVDVAKLLYKIAYSLPVEVELNGVSVLVGGLNAVLMLEVLVCWVKDYTGFWSTRICTVRFRPR